MEELQMALQPLEPYTLELLLVFIVVSLLLFLWISVSLARVSTYTRRIQKMLTGTSGENLETLIRECLATGQETSEQLTSLGGQLRSLAESQKQCLQKVGLVRYDAYDDVRGKQSFSLAFLNALDSGAVVTGLFGRNDARCYAKAITNGKSEHALSEEEHQAVQIAIHRVEVPRQ